MKGLAVLGMLVLSSCTGVYIGLPLGPVQIGGSVSSEGNTGIHAGAGTAVGGVSVSGTTKKKDSIFVEQAEAEGADEDEHQGDD